MSSKKNKRSQKLGSSRRIKNRNRETEEKDNDDGFQDPGNEEHENEQNQFLTVSENQSSNEASLLHPDQPVMADPIPSTSVLEFSPQPQSQDFKDLPGQADITSKKRKMGSTRKGNKNLTFKGIYEDEAENIVEISEGVSDKLELPVEASIKVDGGEEDQTSQVDSATSQSSEIESFILQAAIQSKPTDISSSELNQSKETELSQNVIDDQSSLTVIIKDPQEGFLAQDIEQDELTGVQSASLINEHEHVTEDENVDSKASTEDENTVEHCLEHTEENSQLSQESIYKSERTDVREDTGEYKEVSAAWDRTDNDSDKGLAATNLKQTMVPDTNAVSPLNLKDHEIETFSEQILSHEVQVDSQTKCYKEEQSDLSGAKYWTEESSADEDIAKKQVDMHFNEEQYRAMGTERAVENYDMQSVNYGQSLSTKVSSTNMLDVVTASSVIPAETPYEETESHQTCNLEHNNPGEFTTELDIKLKEGDFSEQMVEKIVEFSDIETEFVEEENNDIKEEINAGSTESFTKEDIEREDDEDADMSTFKNELEMPSVITNTQDYAFTDQASMVVEEHGIESPDKKRTSPIHAYPTSDSMEHIHETEVTVDMKIFNPIAASPLYSDQLVIAGTSPSTSDLELSPQPQSRNLGKAEVAGQKRKMGSTRKSNRNYKFGGIYEDEQEHRVQISKSIYDEQEVPVETSIKEYRDKDDQTSLVDCAPSQPSENESSILEGKHLDFDTIRQNEDDSKNYEHQHFEAVIQSKPTDISSYELNQSKEAELSQNVIDDQSSTNVIIKDTQEGSHTEDIKQDELTGVQSASLINEHEHVTEDENVAAVILENVDSKASTEDENTVEHCLKHMNENSQLSQESIYKSERTDVREDTGEYKEVSAAWDRTDNDSDKGLAATNLKQTMVPLNLEDQEIETFSEQFLSHEVQVDSQTKCYKEEQSDLSGAKYWKEESSADEDIAKKVAMHFNEEQYRAMGTEREVENGDMQSVNYGQLLSTKVSSTNMLDVVTASSVLPAETPYEETESHQTCNLEQNNPGEFTTELDTKLKEGDFSEQMVEKIVEFSDIETEFVEEENNDIKEEINAGSTESFTKEDFEKEDDENADMSTFKNELEMPSVITNMQDYAFTDQASMVVEEHGIESPDKGGTSLYPTSNLMELISETQVKLDMPVYNPVAVAVPDQKQIMYEECQVYPTNTESETEQFKGKFPIKCIQESKMVQDDSKAEIVRFSPFKKNEVDSSQSILTEHNSEGDQKIMKETIQVQSIEVGTPASEDETVSFTAGTCYPQSLESLSIKEPEAEEMDKNVVVNENTNTSQEHNETPQYISTEVNTNQEGCVLDRQDEETVIVEDVCGRVDITHVELSDVAERLGDIEVHELQSKAAVAARNEKATWEIDQHGEPIPRDMGSIHRTFGGKKEEKDQEKNMYEEEKDMDFTDITTLLGPDNGEENNDKKDINAGHAEEFTTEHTQEYMYSEISSHTFLSSQTTVKHSLKDHFDFQEDKKKSKDVEERNVKIDTQTPKKKKFGSTRRPHGKHRLQAEREEGEWNDLENAEETEHQVIIQPATSDLLTESQNTMSEVTPNIHDSKVTTEQLQVISTEVETETEVIDAPPVVLLVEVDQTNTVVSDEVSNAEGLTEITEQKEQSGEHEEKDPEVIHLDQQEMAPVITKVQDDVLIEHLSLADKAHGTDNECAHEVNILSTCENVENINEEIHVQTQTKKKKKFGSTRRPHGKHQSQAEGGDRELKDLENAEETEHQVIIQPATSDLLTESQNTMSEVTPNIHDSKVTTEQLQIISTEVETGTEGIDASPVVLSVEVDQINTVVSDEVSNAEGLTEITEQKEQSGEHEEKDPEVIHLDKKEMALVITEVQNDNLIEHVSLADKINIEESPDYECASESNVHSTCGPVNLTPETQVLSDMEIHKKDIHAAASDQDKNSTNTGIIEEDKNEAKKERNAGPTENFSQKDITTACSQQLMHCELSTQTTDLGVTQGEYPSPATEHPDFREDDGNSIENMENRNEEIHMQTQTKKKKKFGSTRRPHGKPQLHADGEEGEWKDLENAEETEHQVITQPATSDLLTESQNTMSEVTPNIHDSKVTTEQLQVISPEVETETEVIDAPPVVLSVEVDQTNTVVSDEISNAEGLTEITEQKEQSGEHEVKDPEVIHLDQQEMAPVITKVQDDVLIEHLSLADKAHGTDNECAHEVNILSTCENVENINEEIHVQTQTKKKKKFGSTRRPHGKHQSQAEGEDRELKDLENAEETEHQVIIQPATSDLLTESQNTMSEVTPNIHDSKVTTEQLQIISTEVETGTEKIDASPVVLSVEVDQINTVVSDKVSNAEGLTEITEQKEQLGEHEEKDPEIIHLDQQEMAPVITEVQNDNLMENVSLADKINIEESPNYKCASESNVHSTCGPVNLTPETQVLSDMKIHKKDIHAAASDQDKNSTNTGIIEEDKNEAKKERNAGPTENFSQEDITTACSQQLMHCELSTQTTDLGVTQGEYPSPATEHPDFREDDGNSIENVENRNEEIHMQTQTKKKKKFGSTRRPHGKPQLHADGEEGEWKDLENAEETEHQVITQPATSDLLTESQNTMSEVTPNIHDSLVTTEQIQFSVTEVETETEGIDAPPVVLSVEVDQINTVVSDEVSNAEGLTEIIEQKEQSGEHEEKDPEVIHLDEKEMAPVITKVQDDVLIEHLSLADKAHGTDNECAHEVNLLSTCENVENRNEEMHIQTQTKKKKKFGSTCRPHGKHQLQAEGEDRELKDLENAEETEHQVTTQPVTSDLLTESQNTMSEVTPNIHDSSVTTEQIQFIATEVETETEGIDAPPVVLSVEVDQINTVVSDEVSNAEGLTEITEQKEQSGEHEVKDPEVIHLDQQEMAPVITKVQDDVLIEHLSLADKAHGTDNECAHEVNLLSTCENVENINEEIHVQTQTKKKKKFGSTRRPHGKHQLQAEGEDRELKDLANAEETEHQVIIQTATSDLLTESQNTMSEVTPNIHDLKVTAKQLQIISTEVETGTEEITASPVVLSVEVDQINTVVSDEVSNAEGLTEITEQKEQSGEHKEKDPEVIHLDEKEIAPVITKVQNDNLIEHVSLADKMNIEESPDNECASDVNVLSTCENVEIRNEEIHIQTQTKKKKKFGSTRRPHGKHQLHAEGEDRELKDLENAEETEHQVITQPATSDLFTESQNTMTEVTPNIHDSTVTTEQIQVISTEVKIGTDGIDEPPMHPYTKEVLSFEVDQINTVVSNEVNTAEGLTQITEQKKQPGEHEEKDSEVIHLDQLEMAPVITKVQDDVLTKHLTLADKAHGTDNECAHEVNLLSTCENVENRNEEIHIQTQTKKKKKFGSTHRPHGKHQLQAEGEDRELKDLENAEETEHQIITQPATSDLLTESQNTMSEVTPNIHVSKVTTEQLQVIATEVETGTEGIDATPVVLSVEVDQTNTVVSDEVSNAERLTEITEQKEQSGEHEEKDPEAIHLDQQEMAPIITKVQDDVLIEHLSLADKAHVTDNECAHEVNLHSTCENVENINEEMHIQTQAKKKKKFGSTRRPHGKHQLQAEGEDRELKDLEDVEEIKHQIITQPVTSNLLTESQNTMSEETPNIHDSSGTHEQLQIISTEVSLADKTHSTDSECANEVNVLSTCETVENRNEEIGMQTKKKKKFGSTRRPHGKHQLHSEGEEGEWKDVENTEEIQSIDQAASSNLLTEVENAISDLASDTLGPALRPEHDLGCVENANATQIAYNTHGQMELTPEAETERFETTCPVVQMQELKLSSDDMATQSLGNSGRRRKIGSTRRSLRLIKDKENVQDETAEESTGNSEKDHVQKMSYQLTTEIFHQSIQTLSESLNIIEHESENVDSICENLEEGQSEQEAWQETAAMNPKYAGNKDYLKLVSIEDTESSSCDTKTSIQECETQTHDKPDIDKQSDGSLLSEIEFYLNKSFVNTLNTQALNPNTSELSEPSSQNPQIHMKQSSPARRRKMGSSRKGARKKHAEKISNESRESEQEKENLDRNIDQNRDPKRELKTEDMKESSELMPEVQALYQINESSTQATEQALPEGRRKFGSRRTAKGSSGLGAFTHGDYESNQENTDIQATKDDLRVSDPYLISEPESPPISHPDIVARPETVEGREAGVKGTITSNEAGLVSLESIMKTSPSVVNTGGRPKIDFEREEIPDFGQALYNIVLVGNSNVGKTSFIKRLQSGEFTQDYSATIGVDTFVHTVTFGNNTVKLYVWDTAGQERYHSITRQVFHKAQGLLLMYDITSSQSFQAVRAWISQIKENAPPDVMLMLLGNKNDCETKREVQQQQGENLSKEYDINFMECSVATGENVSDSLKTLAWLLVKQRVRKDGEHTTLQPKPQNKKSGCC